nr:KTSC domain-containing protein [Candidatus Sigynarchaeum springense]
MPAVDSSFIARVEHYPQKEKDGVLVVQFKNGSIRAYYGVPRGIYDDFLNASSKGNFYTREIKGKFKSGQGFFQDAKPGGNSRVRPISAAGFTPLEKFLKK